MFMTLLYRHEFQSRLSTQCMQFGRTWDSSESTARVSQQRNHRNQEKVYLVTMKSGQIQWSLAALSAVGAYHCPPQRLVRLTVCNHTTRLTGDWWITLDSVNPTFNEVRPNHQTPFTTYVLDKFFSALYCFYDWTKKMVYSIYIVQTAISPTFTKFV